MERQIVIRHGEEELAATIPYPVVPELQEGERPSRVPLIIICHGFVGSRIGVDRLFVKTSRELAEDGYLVLRFDYIGCGESSGEYGAEGLESMINQTRTVLDYAIQCCDVDPKRITLLGHSLGGATALLTAVRDKRVNRLIMWSAVGYPFNDIVKITGRSTYDQSVKEGSADHLGYDFSPVFFHSLAQFQPFQEAAKFTGDVFIAHGTSDDTIPVDYAFLFQKVFWMRSTGRCDKDIIFQGNHTFSSGPEREQLIKRTRAWLAEQNRIDEDWQHWMI